MQLNLKNKFWSPLDLSPREENALQKLNKNLLNNPCRVNFSKNQRTSQLLANLMKIHLSDIIERDGLPHLCHVINGWGNAIYKGHSIIECMDLFVHRKKIDQYFILQCDDEGDFHPWQSFAYAVMAGVQPDELISSRGFSLRSLALHSREINTTEGRELGHLLFALSYLDPNVNGPSFYLNNTRYSITDLFELAVHAHHYGNFNVCRKFHLTEGLCAAAVKIFQSDDYQRKAQGFLEGQLDMLIMLAAVLEETKVHSQSNTPISNDSLLLELRETLRIGHLIENHYYYAGHLIELACFAYSLNYNIGLEYWNVMAFIIEELNTTLIDYYPYLSFQDCFLTLGHYRRAITLYEEIIHIKKKNRVFDFSVLKNYTVNFDTFAPQNFIDNSKQKPLSVKEGGVYDIAIVPKNPRPSFIDIINQYAKIAPDNLLPRGKFDHFRRISPPSWPRAFHYELLDYGDKIGIEIHLESESVLPMRPYVESLKDKVSQKFSEHLVEWDPNWYHSYGRLRIIFEGQQIPEVVASLMQNFIEETFSDLDSIASSLETNPMHLSHL